MVDLYFSHIVQLVCSYLKDLTFFIGGGGRVESGKIYNFFLEMEGVVQKMIQYPKMSSVY